ncbi:MAG: S9 family peptidase [Acidobacteria bacterium]|nr:S9 family peptidase [Acidobacteriota bacterium]
MKLTLAVFAFAAYAAPRPLSIEDMHRFKDVADPRCSPDGKWVAYTLTSTNVEADKRDTDIWIAAIDGSASLRVTTSAEAENSPRWSPDGRYLAFLSGRPGTGKNKGSQIWLLDRRGGEAQQLTDSKARISAFEWAPDSKRMAIVLRDEEDDIAKLSEKDKEKLRPIVLDRYSFKRDGEGYLSAKKHSRIHLFDIESKKFELLTNTDFEEASPAWSPDGARLAFTSNHAPDWDRVPSSDIFVVDAIPGAPPKKLTSFPGQDTKPVWSPDGKWIAYLKGSDHMMGEYNVTQLAVVPADGGEVRILTASLDRGVSQVSFRADSKVLEFLVTDDMTVYAARVSLQGGPVEKLSTARQVVASTNSAGACTAALVSTVDKPAEVHIWTSGAWKKLSSHNDALMAGISLGATEEVRFKARDGNEAHGLLTKPVGYIAGRRYPALLRIHGGPNAQDQHSWQFDRHIFAAKGYAVLQVNYRGSSGRGQQYTASIAKDWGNKEVLDLLAGVDHIVSMGVADADNLGVGGWSYGGILTDYLIATTTRFKAATSGAGVAFPLAFYGHDQYIRQYDHEIGPPWKGGLEPWLKIGYPFLHADRIKTPALFLCGDKDFNVPLLGSEQMYQALKNVGVDTQLVIYPGENHGIAKPAFRRDVMERYLAWYAKYLKMPVTESGDR